MLMDVKTLCAELSDVNARVSALCEGLTEEQVARRPNPGKWSIAENLIHLSTTTEVFLPCVDAAIAETRRRKMLDGGAYRLGWFGRLLMWYQEPPPLIRLPAPKILRPLPATGTEPVLDKFLKSQAVMRGRMEDAGDLDLVGFRFPSPLASYIKMNLLEFFCVFNGHSRRHAWQMANVRRELQARQI